MYYLPRSAFKWYCDYDTLKPIFSDHCYLPTNDKAEITSDQDSHGDYDNNKGGVGGI